MARQAHFIGKDTIAFSEGAYGAECHREVQSLLSCIGYTATIRSKEIAPPEGSPSARHLDIVPPLEKESVQELVAGWLIASGVESVDSVYQAPAELAA